MYKSPAGKTVRSRGDLEKYIKKKGLKLDVNAFNFSASVKKKGHTTSSTESSPGQSPDNELPVTAENDSLDGTGSVTDSCTTPQDLQSNQSDIEEAFSDQTTQLQTDRDGITETNDFDRAKELSKKIPH